LITKEISEMTMYTWMAISMSLVAFHRIAGRRDNRSSAKTTPSGSARTPDTAVICSVFCRPSQRNFCT